MEPKQYNAAIYNKEVVLLRDEIRNLEESILNETLIPKTLSDFNRIYEETLHLNTRVEELFQRTSNRVYQLQLDTFFKEEKEFLDEYFSFLEIFKNYHEAAGEQLLNDTIIKQEWEDIVTIIQFLKAEKEMKKNTFSKEKGTLSDFIQNLKENITIFVNEEEPKENVENKEEALEKWKDFVVLTAFLKVDNEVEMVNPSLNGTDYIRLKELYETLEEELYKNIFPRIQRKIKNTTYWNKVKEKLIPIRDVCQEIVEAKEKETIQSFDHILKVAEEPIYYAEQMNEISKDSLENVVDYKKMRTKEYCDERKKDIFMDEAFYEQLTPTSKMKYLGLLLRNIINKTGKIKGESIVKVRIDGKKYVYPRRYQARFEKYRALLKELENAYEQKKEDSLKEAALEEEKNSENAVSLEIDEIVAERYAELVAKLEDVNYKLLLLEEEAKFVSVSEEVVSVSLEGREVSVLKSNYSEYETLYKKKKSIVAAISEIEVRNGYVYDNSEEKNYANVRFIEENEKYPERAKTQKKFWQRKQYYARKGKKNANYASTKGILKSMNIPKKYQEEYAQIASNPEEFLKSKNYTDETKRKAFGNLRSIFNGFSKKKSTNTRLSEIVAEANSKIIESLAKTPVNETEVYKVFNTRRSSDINKIKIQINQKLTATIVLSLAPLAVMASMYVMKNSPISKVEENILADNTAIIEEVTKDLVADLADEIIKIKDSNPNWKLNSEELTFSPVGSAGGSFEGQSVSLETKENNDNIQMHSDVYIKPDALVYSVAGDIVKDGIEPKEFIGDYTVAQEITGIGYMYEGNYVWISDTNADFEAKCRAYDALGVPKVEVRLHPKNAQENEYSGFFSINDLEEQNVMGGRK